MAYYQTGKVGREESQIRLDDKADLILHIKQVAQRQLRLQVLDEGRYALHMQCGVMMRSSRHSTRQLAGPERPARGSSTPGSRRIRSTVAWHFLPYQICKGGPKERRRIPVSKPTAVHAH